MSDYAHIEDGRHEAKVERVHAWESQHRAVADACMTGPVELSEQVGRVLRGRRAGVRPYGSTVYGIVRALIRSTD